MVEDWKRAWRAFVPHLPTRGLAALRAALAAGSPELIQGATTKPPPLTCVADFPVEAACAIGTCGWKDGRATVGEVRDFFANVCVKADHDMGEYTACRWFLNWFDDTPRDIMRRELLPEVELALAGRGVAA